MIRHPAAFFWVRFGRWLAGKSMTALAERCYRHAVSADDAEGWHRLGRSLLNRGEVQESIEAFGRATKLDSRHARAWCGLGAAQRWAAEMEAARQSYERALELDPKLPQALSNLGEWHLVRGNASAALDYVERALAGDGLLLEALANKAVALFELGRYEEAEQSVRYALQRYPKQASLHVNLGNVLFHSGKARQAYVAYRRAVELEPTNEEAHFNLGMLLGQHANLSQAKGYIYRQIKLKGESIQLLAGLALAQAGGHEHREAEATCRKILDRQPGQISALITLAGCLGAKAEHRAANDLSEKALQVNPDMPAIRSNVLFNLTYLPDETPESVFDRHRQWARRHEEPKLPDQPRYSAGDDPERSLRIGYVSGDFKTHPVGFLLRDVVGRHDRTSFQTYCYSMAPEGDELTAAIRAAADVWRDELMSSDSDLAARIRDDRIDVLVDLSGHTAFNRLPVFALRPAPVQATWIGYFHSTGMRSIDYFISDPHTSPSGCGQLFSEIPVHLPHSRFCYSPPDYAPEVVLRPADGAGHVTFGSFNRLDKLVQPVIAAWATIVNGTLGSRLVLKAGALADSAIRDRIEQRFAASGLSADRLDLRGPSKHVEMLEQYGDIDIALDTFPFNGGMTTMEALWMGVPVVTVAGSSVVSRQTLSALENIGVRELVFPDVDTYVQGAIALANDPARLADLRTRLRQAMAGSPIRQAEQFTRDLEALYRRMWRAHCAGQRLPSDIAIDAHGIVPVV